MTRVSDLGRRLKQAHKKMIREADIPAVLGKVRANGAVSLRGDSANGDLLPTNQVYVRLYGLAGDTPRVAWCTAVGLKPNNGVYVRENHDGTYSVVRLWDKRATELLGEKAMDFAGPIRSGVAPNLINGRDAIPLRPHIWIGGTLKINAEKGWYLDSDGIPALWRPPTAGSDDGSCLDLASFVPAASSGISQHGWVLITLDPDANNPALTAIAGPTQFITMPLLESDIAGIAIPDGHLPLAAVKLVTGDADETTVIESDWVDLRFWLLAGRGSSTGSLTVTKTEIEVREVLYENTLAAPGTWDVTGISQDFDDLEIRLLGGIANGSSNDVWVYFNNDTSSGLSGNYSSSYHYGGGATHSVSGVFSASAGAMADASTGTISVVEGFLRDYTNSATQKVFGSQSFLGLNYTRQTTLLWMDTAAINRLTVTAGGTDDFEASTRLTIFGIRRLEVVTDIS